MTTTTTNYGWTIPSDTDLVTNGASAMRTLGQGIDTSLVGLKGGTTGQILSKTSGTDMAFTWITNDVGDITAVTTTAPLQGGASSGAVALTVDAASTTAAGVVQLSNSTSTTSSILAATPTAVKSAYDLADAAIAKTTVTTAGDIIYRNATVPTRLGIGTAGQVLTVNSGATAPQWSTPAGGGGWTSIGTATLSSSVTSVSFTATGYQQICLQMTNVSCAAGGGLLVYPNGGSTAVYVSNGLYQNNTRSTGNTYKSYIYNGVFNLPTSGNYTALVGYFDLPASTTAPKPFRLINSVMESTDFGFFAFDGMVGTATSALSSFSFTHQGGNFTGGSVTVWGIK
jgi:hypothetical protein